MGIYFKMIFKNFRGIYITKRSTCDKHSQRQDQRKKLLVDICEKNF